MKNLSWNKINLLIAGDFYPGIVRPRKLFKSEGIAKLFKNGDFSIVNLEGPLTNSETPINKKGPNLKIDPNWAKTLREMGFGAVSLANNHIMDMGKDGLEDTLRHCSEEALLFFGAGSNLPEARLPLVFENNGLKIGMFAFAEHEFSIATETSPGAAPIDPIDNYNDITALKNQVDFTIAILHGGNEYYSFPRPGLVKLCHFLVDAGANAIVIHHAHTTCGYEIYKEAPIFYSIGNFYFPKKNHENTDWNYGYMVSLKLSKGESVSFELLPYFFDMEGVHLLEGKPKDDFLDDITKKSLAISDPVLLNKNWNLFCEEKQNSYIYTLFSYTRYDRLLFRLKFLRPEFFKTKLLTFINFIQCESHNEALLNSLKLFLTEPENSNRKSSLKDLKVK